MKKDPVNERDLLKRSIQDAGLAELSTEDLETVTGAACGSGCRPGCYTCSPGGSKAENRVY